MTEATVFEPKQRMSAAARRLQLLDVALEKFAARGYHDTSMGEIALAAGVTKPVLYQHFQSKQELYRELLDTMGQQLLSDVAASVASEADPYEGVLAGFRAYLTFVFVRTDAFKLLFGGGSQTSEEFRDSMGNLEQRVAATVGRMILADVDDAHRDLLGYTIVGLAEVVGRRWATSGATQVHSQEAREAAAEQLASRLADFVWAGLRGLPGSAQSGEPASVGHA